MAKSKNGFRSLYLDKKTRPQDDFFQYACGGWIKKNPIPPTKSSWGTFYVLREEGLQRLRRIVTDIDKKKSVGKGSNEQFIRDFYRSGIDMKTRNKRGLEPIQDFLEKISAIRSTNDVLRTIEHLYKKGLPTLFGIFVGQDDKNSEQYITHVVQSGLSLPDRDFYLKKDKKSTQIRNAFVKHIENMFVLAGEARKDARRIAHTVLSFETKLARMSMNKVDARNIDKIYNKQRINVLQRLAPGIAWKTFLNDIHIKDIKHVVVYQPDFIERSFKLLKKTPVETLKVYLRWTLLDDTATLLSSSFVEEHFAFYGKILTGRQTMEPLWKRVIGVLESNIGEILGKEYVKRYFSSGAKKKINTLVDDLFSAYKERLREIDWMSETTKKKALQKLSLISRKLGYPDTWKSYKGLVITSDDYVGNVFRASLFERNRQFSRIGEKVDRKEWHMTPQTVNAYYSPNLNEIVFPAGILQPPFFDVEADDAFNYGAIGSVIGHEITHGFDDEGSKFNDKGNFKNWWTSKDRKRFEEKTKKLVTQFNRYKAGGLQVNGKLTLGENIADLGGVIMAFRAYSRRLNKSGYKNIGGFTPEQRFFLGFSLFECGHYRTELERLQVLTDPHSPSRFRINGPLSNLPEFYTAFNVQKGDKLYRAPRDRVKVW